jgi:guanylate kinase
LEMTFKDQFDVVLVNENLENSLAEAQRLYDEFKIK